MDSVLKKKMDDFQAACRARDLKVTPQRMEIFRELAEAEDHPTAEKIHQRLSERLPSLSLDTVYRTLRTFAEMGLILRVETTDSQAYFEVSHAPHHHLICEKCKKIIDFQWQQMDEAQLPEEVRALGRFEKKNVVVYGICNRCLGK